MTQDTRKDRRVKIVSLNVRYKSATVDEFIENHAHDVSRGGIYIKTANPFPAGTLLKFEIRLASDQAVIAGVGRVVWKRDSTQTSGERPGGMGVKFIKLDAPSTAVIDKLVNTRADAGKAFEDEPQSAGEATPPPPAAAPAASPMRKQTMMGIGIPSTPPAKPAASHPPAPRSTTPAPAAALVPPRPVASVFPKTNPEAEMPPKQEQTVMKQAAELLEEALREAGGSMEDVGTNPLFAGATGAKVVAEPTPLPPAIAPEGGVDPFKDDAAKAKALVAEIAPAPAAQKKTPSEPPLTRRDTPVAMAPDRHKASVRPAASRSVPASEAPPPAKKSRSGLVFALVVLAAAGAGVVVFRDALFGSGGGGPVATTPPAPAPTASVAVMASGSTAPAMSASAAPEASVSASASASASAGPATSTSAAASVKAAPVAPATPTATATATSTPTPPAAPAPKPPPAAVATAAPAPPAPAPAAPKPKPKPKVDDNPY